MKGSEKKKLVEFAPKFAVDFIDLIEQNRRNRGYFEDFCEKRRHTKGYVETFRKSLMYGGLDCQEIAEGDIMTPNFLFTV